jgi:hypothetical protein
MADLPGGASGLLVRDYKGKEADVLVTRSAPGVVSLLAELRQMSQALNRLRAMVSPPEYSPPMPRPRRATTDGWA